MQSYQKLLLANKAWAADKLRVDEQYFEELAADQKPEFLWIGCADSRVPANEVTGTAPGEIFVHRNVANLVIHTDINMLSVLQYAVEVLEVKHILVVGHYGCGGVKAAMSNKDFGLINKWLRNIKDVYSKHSEELEDIEDFDQRFNKLVEFNVMEQAKNLAKTTIIQRAWKKRQYPHIHGWVFDLHTGLITQTSEILPGAEVESIYRYDFEEYGEELTQHYNNS
ncbi:carbonate dehydratase [Runella zeae]|uniref:carbonate dehydratase n=1 Tax=Runella zeae TaxID=94255 RepID=UPI0004049DAE|nr:carbonate dehydratase [Runella zeae]